MLSPENTWNYLAGPHHQRIEVRERTGLPAVSETISQRILSMLGHMSRMPPSAKTFLLTGGDDLVDLDSPGWLPYTVIYGSLTSAWTTFLNLLLTVYYGGGWFVALRTTLVHATDDE